MPWPQQVPGSATVYAKDSAVSAEVEFAHPGRGFSMLGWMITVNRQADGGASPAVRDSVAGDLVAQWQGGLDAIDWLRDLTETGDAVDLGGNGYPFLMTAKASAVLHVIESGPPYENKRWKHDVGDILTPRWVGRTVFDPEVAQTCVSDEWLMIEIYDES